MKNVCILGSTGSIGRAALEVIRSLKPRFEVFALSCHKQTELLEQQIAEFKPKYVCITDEESAKKFTHDVGARLPRLHKQDIYTGESGLCTISAHPDVDILLNALVGTQGIYPTLSAIRSKKRIAMANKETIVAYGEIIMQEVAQYSAILLPVDSEHSAIHQCIGSKREAVRRIILTASGGPFLHKDITDETTLNEALGHPVWQMGEKITIDSSTLMNKGLEVIEAVVLFGLPVDCIEVVIHPQSIIHSAVEFVDGSIIAQLSLPDMRLPIQYALTYPERLPSLTKSLKFDKIKRLDFFRPDFDKFPCLRLAYEAANKGGTMPCVLNGANEVAVRAFLHHEIKLPQLPEIIEEVMVRHKVVKSPTISDIEDADLWARREAEKIIREMI